MRENTAESAQRGEDEGPLLCPHCDYNLTGLPEHRCPECGETFDPNVLKRLASRRARRATPWDRDRNVRGFWKTWWLAIRSPRQLAAAFPARHDRLRALTYSWLCYLSAVLVTWGVGLLFAKGSGNQIEFEDATGILVAATFGGLTAFWLCEVAMAGVLALSVRPKWGRRPYHFWRGLTHYTSGYTILTALPMGLFFGALAARARLGWVETLSWILSASAFGWWLISLERIVLAGGRSSLGCALACLILVPAVSLAAIGFGYLLTVLIAFETVGL